MTAKNSHAKIIEHVIDKLQHVDLGTERTDLVHELGKFSPWTRSDDDYRKEILDKLHYRTDVNIIELSKCTDWLRSVLKDLK